MDYIHAILECVEGLFSIPTVIGIIAIIFVAANVKNLLLVYHIRCFNAIIKHHYLTPHNWKQNNPDLSTLFQPIITSSHTSLLECDYNNHKSNSTYFTDLDVSRLHLIYCLFGRGIKTLQSKPIIGPRGGVIRGDFRFVLGGVECSFRHEIKPYERYDIWTRVLAWDRKWLYLVSHFVKKGSVKPAGFTLSDGKWFGQTCKRRNKTSQKDTENVYSNTGGYRAANPDGATNEDSATVNDTAILASAISKYVFKMGRLTIHPEVVFEASELLPVRPGGWATVSGPAPSVDTSSLDNMHTDTEWTWKQVGVENMRGLKLAENFAALDGLGEVFTGNDRPALGIYSDLII